MNRLAQVMIMTKARVRRIGRRRRLDRKAKRLMRHWKRQGVFGKSTARYWPKTVQRRIDKIVAENTRG